MVVVRVMSSVIMMPPPMPKVMLVLGLVFVLGLVLVLGLVPGLGLGLHHL